MSPSIKIVIEFPALDRLVDFLTSNQQAEIDQASDKVNALAQRLKTSNDQLQLITDKGQ